LCKSKLNLNKNIENELQKFKNLKVKCLCNSPNCKFTFKYEKLLDSLNFCNKTKFLKCFGCDCLFSNLDIKDHIMICEHLLYSCEYCGKKFRRNKILRHTIDCIIEMKKKEHNDLAKKLLDEQNNLEKFFADQKDKEQLIVLQKHKIQDYEDFHIFLFYLFVLLSIVCFFWTVKYIFSMIF